MDGWKERLIHSQGFKDVIFLQITFLQTITTLAQSLNRFYQSFSYLSAHICAVFKVDPKQDGAKLKDPEIDKELVYLIMDKVDQVFHNFAQILGFIHK